MQIVKGVMIISIIAFISDKLNLETLNYIITNFKIEFVVALIIIFQPELRRLLTQFGQKSWIAGSSVDEIFQLDELVNAIFSMAEDKIGSIIVIERSSGLKNYAESGVIINAGISEEIIRTIFFPNTTLHDGAIIIQEGKITAAACYLPLSDSKQLKKYHGARHRAALGIAEESDALVIVTSEEKGTISIMVNGKIYPRIKSIDLKNMILFYMNPKTGYEEKYSIK
jgi:diadenylate cyclase